VNVVPETVATMELLIPSVNVEPAPASASVTPPPDVRTRSFVVSPVAASTTNCGVLRFVIVLFIDAEVVVIEFDADKKLAVADVETELICD